MPALAITDHGNMYGVKVFMNEAKKHPDVKPIIGCEVYVTRHYDHRLKDNEHRKYETLVEIAKCLNVEIQDLFWPIENIAINDLSEE